MKAAVRQVHQTVTLSLMTYFGSIFKVTHAFAYHQILISALAFFTILMIHPWLDTLDSTKRMKAYAVHFIGPGWRAMLKHMSLPVNSANETNRCSNTQQACSNPWQSQVKDGTQSPWILLSDSPRPRDPSTP
jgi:hypothetical protein